MFYPEDFKARCKAVYPDWAVLHEMLEEGNLYVGRGLTDSAQWNPSYRDILKATSLEELQAKAKIVEEKADLYFEWRRLYDEQFLPQ